MKRKMDKSEKTRRQAWRDRALENRTVFGPPEYTHTPKALRVEKDTETKVVLSEVKDLRRVVADLFKGTIYSGPYVHVSHKQAFEARQLKRAAKALANVAMETVQK